MFIRVIRKVTLSSPSLWASFHPLSSLSEVYSAFNAQGSRLIIIGAVKIYVAAVEALRRKER